MKKIVVRSFVALVAVFVLIQLVPVDRTNPPETKPLQAPEDVLRILRRSCYDCHSNQTTWPWYAYVAPVSWLVAHDVEEGRGTLNFSEWGAYDENKRLGKADEIKEQIERGKMPMPKYLKLHPDARLSELDRGVLWKWAENVE